MQAQINSIGATCNVQPVVLQPSIKSLQNMFVFMITNGRLYSVHRVTVNSYQLTVNIDHVVRLSNEPLEQGRRRRDCVRMRHVCLRACTSAFITTQTPAHILIHTYIHIIFIYLFICSQLPKSQVTQIARSICLA